MKLNSIQLEDDSIHYYIPQNGENSDFMYSPISVGYFNCKPAYRVERHSYNNYLVIVMLTGALSYTTLRGSGIVRPGYALLLDCHHPHSYKANGKCTFLFLHFDGAQSRSICQAIESTMGNVLRLPNPAPICESIAEIINYMSTGKRIYIPHASLLVYGVLMHLLSSAPVNNEGTTGHLTIDRALDYIHQHLAEKISVQDIAEYVGYSKSYFSKLFIETVGMTPYKFLIHGRLEHAQQLLQTTNMPIQDIATLTGFNTIANFSHMFKKETGCVPARTAAVMLPSKMRRQPVP